MPTASHMMIRKESFPDHRYREKSLRSSSKCGAVCRGEAGQAVQFSRSDTIFRGALDNSLAVYYKGKKLNITEIEEARNRLLA